MTMNQERRMNTMKRLSKLNEKLARINSAIAARNHSGHPEDIKTRRLLQKDQTSTINAIKRCLKEVGAA